MVLTGPGRHLDGDAALGCVYQRNIPLWRFWPVLAVAGSVSPFKIELS